MADQRPLIATGFMTEYGEVDLRSEDLEAGGGGVDFTYVKGFSDMRRTADIARAEGGRVSPLPVNLRWFRRTNRDGTPHNARLVVAANAHYRPVLATEIGQHDWIREMPAAAHVLPDGTIGNADSQLMVLDGKEAGTRAAAKTLKWLEQAKGSQVAALEAAGARLPGSNPEISFSKGPVTA